jgi:hypothetical protein
LSAALTEGGIDAHVAELGVYNDETWLLRTAKRLRNIPSGYSAVDAHRP